MNDTPTDFDHNNPETLTAEQVKQFQALAQERVRQGLALPPEFYSLPLRDRLDWSKFPSWTWPIDPEMFCECVHEG